MNNVESVVNSRRDWYDHSGKLLTKVVTPILPSIANITKQYSKQLSNRKNVGSGENGQVYNVPAGKQ